MNKLELERPIVVIGAGVMGHGIAQLAAQVGFTARLVDIELARAEAGKAAVAAALERRVAAGKLPAAERDAVLARIHCASDVALACSDVQLAIEAAPEVLTLKRELFVTLSRCCPDDALLATNTSSLPVTEIAAASADPTRVIGMHFFNPPVAMPLLEIIRGERSSAATIERARAFGTALGKELVEVADAPGFASSRLGILLGMEAIRMVESGVASAADIDRAMELGYRHPMGPLKLTDLVGLDVRLRIAEYLHAELGSDAFLPPQLLKRLVRAGKLGKKTGEGFYRWDAAGRATPAR
jgi:3-hydroxybutyryl-CoA dehydrogenase